MTTIYRNYRISKLGDQFVAQSVDDDCLLISTSQRRLNAAIDDLWSSLERGAEPAWFTGSSAIDVDTFGPESAASETDPPAANTWTISYPLFLASAVLVSAPLSYFMALKHIPARIDVILAIGVVAVSVAFGKRFALMASVISAFVFNFFAIEPLLSFSIPTFEETIFWVVNVAASWGIPELIKLRDYLGSRVKDRTPRT
ncbi:DUF4118 domain-containing protein [Bradyrhizobium denitrificans]